MYAVSTARYAVKAVNSLSPTQVSPSPTACNPPSRLGCINCEASPTPTDPPSNMYSPGIYKLDTFIKQNNTQKLRPHRKQYLQRLTLPREGTEGWTAATMNRYSTAHVVLSKALVARALSPWQPLIAVRCPPALLWLLLYCTVYHAPRHKTSGKRSLCPCPVPSFVRRYNGNGKNVGHFKEVPLRAKPGMYHSRGGGGCKLLC